MVSYQSCRRIGAGLVFLFLSTSFIAEANACWFGHCRCRTHHRTASAPGYAPAQAPANQVVQTPVYAPPSFAVSTIATVPYSYVAAPSSAPQQGLISSIGDIREIIGLLQELRGGASGGDSGGGGTAPCDTSKLEAAVARLEAGQADLKGRLINNAGIGQSIGERLVAMDKKLDGGMAATSESDLEKLIRRMEEEWERREEEEDDEEEDAAEELRADVEELRDRLTEIEDKVEKLEGIETAVNDTRNAIVEILSEMKQIKERLPVQEEGGDEGDE